MRASPIWAADTPGPQSRDDSYTQENHDIRAIHHNSQADNLEIGDIYGGDEHQEQFDSFQLPQVLHDLIVLNFHH